jgi:transposase
MMIIGVDYHPSFQTIAFLMEETGECGELELNHSDGQAERFYRDLQQRGIRIRVGMEATGYSRWFERLLAELGIEIWMGDPAEIKAKRVKKRKTDRNDALLVLRLMRENNFPQIWVPGPENRDLRQLLWHRHCMVQMRTRIMNQLQALAMNEGCRWKKKLFSEPGRAQLEKLTLAPWASRRRRELLELLDRMNPLPLHRVKCRICLGQEALDGITIYGIHGNSEAHGKPWSFAVIGNALEDTLCH